MDSLSNKTTHQEFLKVPPHDIEAEQAVLGALMINKSAIIKVVDILLPQDFYKGSHQKIYEAIISLYEKRQPIDILSVTTRLKERAWLDDVGGRSYLADLVNMVPSAMHVEHYAKIVRQKRILRELISTSLEIAESALSSQEEQQMETLLDEVEQKIFGITQRAVTQDFARLEDELHTAFERIDRLHKGEGEVSGIPTGFIEVDKRLSGLQKSDLILVGARPSLGKTSLALDIARKVAVRYEEPVGVFSLEMSRSQIVDRLIAAEAQVNLQDMRTGKLDLSSDAFDRIQGALDRLSKAPLFIDDTPSPNILQMRAMARRLQMEHGLSLLIIDYLQLIAPRNPRDNMVHQITEVSRGLKSLARELQVPVIALSQLSRAADQRDDKTPRLHDLRESGSLEQDSDIVLFISRKHKDRDDLSPEEQNTTDIHIAKYRNGATGKFKLIFNPHYASFQDPAYGHEEYR